MVDENVGLRCPECGKSMEISVQIDQWYSVDRETGDLESLDSNLGLESDVEPTDSAVCHCCGHHDTVRAFRAKSVAQMLLEVAERVVKKLGGVERPHGQLWQDRYDELNTEGGGIVPIAEAAIAAVKERGLDG